MFSKSTVKYIQSLQHKKFRDQYHVFVAEGPKVVTELFKSNKFTCKAIYALQNWVTGLDKKTALSMEGCIEIIEDFELEKIASFSTANKVLAVFEKKMAEQNITTRHKLTLVLDDIRDPGNLGTIIRTADWFGIENIICSENTVDMYNPKVVQSTMASLGRVNVFYTGLEKWINSTAGTIKLAATVNGSFLKEVSHNREAILIIGNESNGISDALLRLADKKITIPGSGSAESLNAAVATGILLYAFCEQGPDVKDQM